MRLSFFPTVLRLRPVTSAISSWVNGVLVLNALRSQVICLPTELSGIVTVAGAAVGEV